MTDDALPEELEAMMQFVLPMRRYGLRAAIRQALAAGRMTRVRLSATPKGERVLELAPDSRPSKWVRDLDADFVQRWMTNQAERWALDRELTERWGT